MARRYSQLLCFALEKAVFCCSEKGSSYSSTHRDPAILMGAMEGLASERRVWPLCQGCGPVPTLTPGTSRHETGPELLELLHKMQKMSHR